MKLSLVLSSSFQNPAIQRLVEVEQNIFMFRLLSVFTKSLSTHEQHQIAGELSRLTALDEVPEEITDRILNMIVLNHLHQGLTSLSSAVDFGSFEELVNSFPHSLLLELLEGLLSSFQVQLDTVTLTQADLDQAIAKYGMKSDSGTSLWIGDDLFKDALIALEVKMPRYLNAIPTATELQASQTMVGPYQVIEAQTRVTNHDLKAKINQFIHTAWRKGYWKGSNVERLFQRLIGMQQRNYPVFSHRPIGYLAIRVRDYISLQTKIPSISTEYLEKLFQEILEMFQTEALTFLQNENFISETGVLREGVQLDSLTQALQQHRSHVSPSLIEALSSRFTSLRDGLYQWDVLMAVSGVKIEGGTQIPALNGIIFLTQQEAQDYFNERRQDDWLNLNFSKAPGVLLISGIPARNAQRAAQVAYRKARTTLNQVLFFSKYGSLSNPQPHPGYAFCLSYISTGEQQAWRGLAVEQRTTDEFLVRHPNIVKEQTDLFNNLSTLLNTANVNHPLANRILSAIYWYRKGWLSDLTEDQMLNYWVSLETLVGRREGTKKTIIPYRTALLAPARVAVDGIITYGQLRGWTQEFIEYIYKLRNEIVHGGVVEGPSFERFVERFRVTVWRTILTASRPFTSNLPVPDNLEELLAWILDKNPDNQVAVANNQPSSK
ncbi:MAG TPA: hypothetical protein VGD31_16975 [Sphingobacteriaceae bacterium]